MSFFSTHNPCLCESGLDYLYCCGAPDRRQLNTVARIGLDDTLELEKLTCEIRNSIENIATTPDWYPIKIDNHTGVSLFVKMSPFWYMESIFLDANRILGTYAVEFDQDFLQRKLAGLKWNYTPVIFHTAFCGSTLLSKILSVAYESLPLREPDLLGSLFSHTQDDAGFGEKHLDRVMGLLSRRYNERQIVIIKANDYANGLMKTLVAKKEQTPVLFMYAPLSEFLAGCLKDGSRRSWIAERYNFVKNKLSGFFPDFQCFSKEEIDSKSIGEKAALYWSYNIASYLEVFESYPASIRCIDFNQMLDVPEETVSACAEWFGLKAISGVSLSNEIHSMFNVYSKGGQEYNKLQRREDINSILEENPEELLLASNLAKNILGQYALGEELPGQLYTRETTQPPRGFIKRFFLGRELVE